MSIIETTHETEDERRFRVNLSGGRHILVYVRHPQRRAFPASGQQKSHEIYITRLAETALTYEDWQTFQNAINFISIAVKDTKPKFDEIMGDLTRRLDVYN